MVALLSRQEGVFHPIPLTHVIRFGCRVYTLAFDVQTSVQEDGTTFYKWTEAKFGIPAPTYGEIVAAVVRGRYSADDMESIVNNYLDDPDEEHTREWSEMQAWRKKAKALAKSILAQME